MSPKRPMSLSTVYLMPITCVFKNERIWLVFKLKTARLKIPLQIWNSWTTTLSKNGILGFIILSAYGILGSVNSPDMEFLVPLFCPDLEFFLLLFCPDMEFSVHFLSRDEIIRSISLSRHGIFWSLYFIQT